MSSNPKYTRSMYEARCVRCCVIALCLICDGFARLFGRPRIRTHCGHTNNTNYTHTQPPNGRAHRAICLLHIRFTIQKLFQRMCVSLSTPHATSKVWCEGAQVWLTMESCRCDDAGCLPYEYSVN